MMSLIRRWFGLRCWLHLCGGKIGFTCDGGICWRCQHCLREIE